MNTEQALAVIETAKTFLDGIKTRNAQLVAELTALRDANSANIGVISALNEQIAKLQVDDAAVDAALADLAAAVAPPAEEPAPPAPVTPAVPAEGTPVVTEDPVTDGTTSEPS